MFDPSFLAFIAVGFAVCAVTTFGGQFQKLPVHFAEPVVRKVLVSVPASELEMYQAIREMVPRTIKEERLKNAALQVRLWDAINKSDAVETSLPKKRQPKPSFFGQFAALAIAR